MVAVIFITTLIVAGGLAALIIYILRREFTHSRHFTIERKLMFCWQFNKKGKLGEEGKD